MIEPTITVKGRTGVWMLPRRRLRLRLVWRLAGYFTIEAEHDRNPTVIDVGRWRPSSDDTARFGRRLAIADAREATKEALRRVRKAIRKGDPEVTL